MWRDTVPGQQAQLSQKPRGSPKGQPRRFLREGRRKQTQNARRQLARVAARAPEPLSDYEAGVWLVMEQRIAVWLASKRARRDVSGAA